MFPRVADRSRSVSSGLTAPYRSQPGACGDGFDIRRLPWVELFGANALGYPDLIVTPHPLHRDLAATAEARQPAYRMLSEGELDAETLQRLRECTNGGFVLGSAKFERQIAAMVGRRTSKGSPGRPRKEEPDAGQAQLGLW